MSKRPVFKKKVEIALPDSAKAVIEAKLRAKRSVQVSKASLTITSQVDDKTASKIACGGLAFDTKKGSFTKESMEECETSMIYTDKTKPDPVKVAGTVKFDQANACTTNVFESKGVPCEDEHVQRASITMKKQLTDDVMLDMHCPSVSIDTINNTIDPESLKDCQTRLIEVEGAKPAHGELASIKFSNVVDDDLAGDDQDDDDEKDDKK